MVEQLTEEKTVRDEEQKNIIYVSLELIRPNPYQPRKQFKMGALDELCQSIQQYGVLQPVSVRKISNTSYELVAGERRFRASTMAGLKEIPAIVVNIDDNDSAVMALIENLQREDLSYMEEAEGYCNLINEHGLTQEKLAKKIGKSQSTIANKIRLLKLAESIKDELTDNNLSERHARALLKLHSEALQLKVVRYICHKGLNVKKTEELIEKIIDKYTKKESVKKPAGKFTRAIKDIRIFVNSIKQAIEEMKKSGVPAKAAQLDRGNYMEFIVRIPKEINGTV
jgi:ParB family chromosome partitioning protein